jgi:integrase
MILEATMALTLRTVNAQKPASTRYVVWDGEVSGFGLRVTPDGDRIYVLKYRTRDGRQRWYTIGRHGSPWTPDSARREARRLLGDVAAGDDPARDKGESRAVPTLAAFAGRYLAEHAAVKKKPSSVRMDRLNLENHVLPALGRRTLPEIGRADVLRFHHAMKDRPGAANRCLALLSKMMNLAEAWGLRPDGSNPCRHVGKFPEHARKRFLSATELTRLGAALAKAEKDKAILPQFAALVRLLLFTGARLTEIQRARWDWVDTAAGILRLPDSKTGQKDIMLPAPALDVLSRQSRIEGCPYIIAGTLKRRTNNDGGTAPDDQAQRIGYLVNVWKPWAMLRRLAGIADVRLHDLRHSFASVGAAGGLPLNVIGGLLGHTQAQTTKRYEHLANDPLRVAANRIAGQIAASMRGGQSNVVRMRAWRGR